MNTPFIFRYKHTGTNSRTCINTYDIGHWSSMQVIPVVYRLNLSTVLRHRCTHHLYCIRLIILQYVQVTKPVYRYGCVRMVMQD